MEVKPDVPPETSDSHARERGQMSLTIHTSLHDVLQTVMFVVVVVGLLVMKR